MKKKITPLIILIPLFSYGQIGVGTTAPHASSILEISSTEKGFLPPRLTTSERDAILDPSEGLMIYNKTVECIEFYNAIEWKNICNSEAILPEVPLTGLNLDCPTIQINPNTGTAGQNYVGVLEVPISFVGTSQSYAGATEFTSTSVTGITAKLRPGSVTNGSSTNVLIFDVTGTPSNTGAASLIIDFNQLPIGGCGVVLSII